MRPLEVVLGGGCSSGGGAAATPLPAPLLPAPPTRRCSVVFDAALCEAV
jgi:hypothetical protein